METRKKWKMPAWMRGYRKAVSDGDRIEEFMNCDGVNCNVEVNSPRALCCVSTTAQVGLLIRLKNKGLLPSDFNYVKEVSK